MGTGTYRVVIIGPGDEVLDTLNLDGLDMTRKVEQDYIGEKVAQGMGRDARAHCATLPTREED